MPCRQVGAVVGIVLASVGILACGSFACFKVAMRKSTVAPVDVEAAVVSDNNKAPKASSDDPHASLDQSRPGGAQGESRASGASNAQGKITNGVEPVDSQHSTVFGNTLVGSSPEDDHPDRTEQASAGDEQGAASPAQQGDITISSTRKVLRRETTTVKGPDGKTTTTENVTEVTTTTETKFAGSVGSLVLGKAFVAAGGLRRAIGLEDDHALAIKLKQAEEAIELEFHQHGSEQDKQNFNYVYRGTAQNWDDYPDHVKAEIEKGEYHGGKLEKDDFDRGHAGMKIKDFIDHPNSKIAHLNICNVLALRLYTTNSYPRFNRPLRDDVCPHPFQMSVYYLDDALHKLRRVESEQDEDNYIKEVVLYRGMKDMELSNTEGFLKRGGCEKAPMSTTPNRDVALKYAKSNKPLLFKYKASALEKGSSINWLSVYPGEEEVLYRSLTLLKPLSEKLETIEEDGMSITVIEVTPQQS